MFSAVFPAKAHQTERVQQQPDQTGQRFLRIARSVRRRSVQQSNRLDIAQSGGPNPMRQPLGHHKDGHFVARYVWGFGYTCGKLMSILQFTLTNSLSHRQSCTLSQRSRPAHPDAERAGGPNQGHGSLYGAAGGIFRTHRRCHVERVSLAACYEAHRTGRCARDSRTNSAGDASRSCCG